jgi:DNA-binding LytR/AlgR family response regulator
MIPAVNEATGKIEFIPIQEILFIRIFKNDVVYYHTFKGTFRRVKGVSEYTKAFEQRGFSEASRSILAQVDRATRYDRIYRMAYFDHDEYYTQACEVSKDVGEYLDQKLNR